MAELRIRAELTAGAADRPDEAARRIQKLLLDRIRIRIGVELVPEGSMARTEAGKVKRVFEQTDDNDPLDG
jgi:hypothetical protein